MTKTSHLTIRSPEVAEFAEGREISNDIALEILRMADGEFDIAQRIWDEPTPGEEKAIRAACPNGIWG